MYEAMMAQEGDAFTLQIEREPGNGESFSVEAMNEMLSEMGVWVGTRIMRRWVQTNEPPTVLTVTVIATVG